MAYKLKKANEFINYISTYLNQNPLDLDKFCLAIDGFSNNESKKTLSDLYSLFLKLKYETLNNSQINILANILKNDFSLNSEDFIDIETDSITDQNISNLESIIKEKFLQAVSDRSIISDEEFFNLASIVNKKFPDVFLSLANPQDKNISKQQNVINNRILETLDHWNRHNTPEAEEENKDIAVAFYITAKRLYPDLDIYIPGRIKSAKSSTTNIAKEIQKKLADIQPENIQSGITDKEVEEQFDLSGANNDFSGFTIVLSNTNDTLHFDMTDPKTAEILKLRKNRKNNINFSHSLENFLLDNDDYTCFSKLDLLQMKIELLMRLREATYPECTKEYKNTSFNELLRYSIKDYKNNYSNLKQPAEKDDIDEIYNLLDELKKRVHDKYQDKLLDMAIPEIFNDRIFNELRVKSHLVKRVRKPNGYCSTYYCIETETGRKIEVQAQSKMRFNDSKSGPSDHSTLPNKEVDISHFFEPVNPDLDEKLFNALLKLLNTTPVATKTFLNRAPLSELDPTQKRLKNRLRVAEENIKLKDSFGEQDYPLEMYLPLFAEYISPKLMSVSSHHTRTHTNVANYNKKSLNSGFNEVLLKHDSTSCLAQILLDKLEEIMPDSESEASLNSIRAHISKRFGIPLSTDDDAR